MYWQQKVGNRIDRSIPNFSRVKQLMIIVSASAVVFSLPRFFEVAVKCTEVADVSESIGLLEECEPFVHTTLLTHVKLAVVCFNYLVSVFFLLDRVSNPSEFSLRNHRPRYLLFCLNLVYIFCIEQVWSASKVFVPANCFRKFNRRRDQKEQYSRQWTLFKQERPPC